MDQEFSGTEPCPICYCVLHMSTHKLPRMGCPTCGNRFHDACLYKWFQTANKSKCPLCQQPFFG